jgi:hypothetical protein
MSVALQKRDVTEVEETGGPSVPEIVERYRGGELLSEIAKECVVSHRTLYRWMLAEVGGERYRELVTECLVARIADADAELEEARRSRDPVRVTAAREVGKFARMDFERRRPEFYGAKMEHAHTHSFDLGDRLRRAKGRVLEMEKPVLSAPDGGGTG